jgi:hypothetical protein
MIIVVNGRQLARRAGQAAATASTLAAAGTAAAATGPMEGLYPLIDMIRDWGKPIGIGLAMWGAVDWGMGNPEGRLRVKSAVLMYTALWLIPYIFDALEGGFSHSAKAR